MEGQLDQWEDLVALAGSWGEDEQEDVGPREAQEEKKQETDEPRVNPDSAPRSKPGPLKPA